MIANPRISIVALIYRSPNYATAFYRHLIEATPQLETNEAEFLYVANNAKRSVIRTLEDEGIPFVKFERRKSSKHELFKRGFAKPEYISRVYAAYNFGVLQSRGDLVVLLNSDMVLSPGWLLSLEQESSDSLVLSPQLVERRHPRFGIFPGAIEANFGRDFKTFRSKQWNEYSSVFASTHQTNDLQSGGPYMPAIFRRVWFESYGGFPEGNIAGSHYREVVEFGDAYFFRKLEQFGISHMTTPRALCYHFKEGERSSSKVMLVRSLLIPKLIHIVKSCFGSRSRV